MSDATNTPNRKNPIAAVFLDHPATVNETYFQHMRFALGFAFWLTVAGLAALVHAAIPALCETTAGRILKRLTAKMESRHKDVSYRRLYRPCHSAGKYHRPPRSFVA
jgi:hypothetical protein